jgi:hypothetical protein
MEIIDWFVPNMSPVSWNRLLMLSAKNEGGDGRRGTPPPITEPQDLLSSSSS